MMVVTVTTTIITIITIIYGHLTLTRAPPVSKSVGAKAAPSQTFHGFRWLKLTTLNLSKIATLFSTKAHPN